MKPYMSMKYEIFKTLTLQLCITVKSAKLGSILTPNSFFRGLFESLPLVLSCSILKLHGGDNDKFNTTVKLDRLYLM